MSYATIDDVEARYRPLSTEETTQVETLLEDVEDMILERVPDLSYWISSGALRENTIKRIEANAVIRFLKNPDGVRQSSVDNFSVTIDSELSAGKVYLTEEEWRTIARATGRRGGAFSIDISGTATRKDNNWTPTNPDALRVVPSGVEGIWQVVR